MSKRPPVHEAAVRKVQPLPNLKAKLPTGEHGTKALDSQDAATQQHYVGGARPPAQKFLTSGPGPRFTHAVSANHLNRVPGPSAVNSHVQRARG